MLFRTIYCRLYKVLYVRGKDCSAICQKQSKFPEGVCCINPYPAQFKLLTIKKNQSRKWRIIGLNLTEVGDKKSRECRARSDCTYVWADLALHAPQSKSMIANGRIRV